MADMNNVKKHPAFLAFWGSNVSQSKEETQSERDQAIDNKERKSDAAKGK